MKIAAFQPPYPYQPQQMPKLAEWLLNALDGCDGSLDLIILPEACNAMSSYDSVEAFYQHVETYGPPLKRKAAETAKRCGALVAINLYSLTEGRYRNVTQVYGRQGTLVGQYFKQHLPEGETREMGIDGSYTRDYHAPYILEAEGVRYAFLTCYDCYFNEYVQHIAARKPDVLIVSALQRAEYSDMLGVEMKNAAFVCNAFAVRSSVSMGDADFEYGASTMVVSPKGKVLASLGQQVGVLCCELDPKTKHYRPDGYNHPEILNDRFIEKGRTPWAYRACGASVCLDDASMPYPRVCAHRGFNTIAPENSMPAFGAAVALGAQELEMDVWATRDGRIVVCHDDAVDRTSNGHGYIRDLTWEEIRRLDIGSPFGSAFSGLGFCLLEEVLARFARQVIVNLHIKTPGKAEVYDEAVFVKILEIIDRYDMREHVYIAGEEDVLRTACKLAPELPRAALDGKLDFTLVALAKKYGCQKLQLVRDYYTQAMVEEARAAGIRCNLFWSDLPQEIPALLASGIDTILTNDYLRMACVFRQATEKQ